MKPLQVNGSSCLAYVDKAIGFANIRGRFDNTGFLDGGAYWGGLFNLALRRQDSAIVDRQTALNPTLWFCSHNVNKRIAGIVLDKYPDGGLKIAIVGDETIAPNKVSITKLTATAGQSYTAEEQPDGSYINIKDDNWNQYPAYNESVSGSGLSFRFSDDVLSQNISFDDAIDYTPTFHNAELKDFHGGQALAFKYRGNDITGNTSNSFQITTNKNNTLTYGENVLSVDPAVMIFSCYGASGGFNPLECISGNIYNYAIQMSTDFYNSCPQRLDNSSFLTMHIDVGNPVNAEVSSPFECFNGICIPYNLVLFDNENEALAYVNSGVISDSAFLFPLDWDDLPRYQVPDDDDTPGEDNNTPDDTTRDVTPNLPVIPSFTPQQLSNNNYYWLTAPQLQSFLNWYWTDIGDITDIDDLLAKIEGLYNNLSQAILNIRFMPVDYDWICHLPSGATIPTGNIKIAQIEKAGAVDMLAKTGQPIVRDVGNIHIDTKYESFVDLSPYSQLSLYLPYHGFIDLDMNIFNGHDIYVKAIYDFLSGTIQYLIYYDNQFLVTSVICKMAVDVPISLQTKNDRDSAIFNNVSNVVGGLMGAGLSIGTGNPMGLVVGASAFNSGVASAPLNVKGNVGEQGAFYSPPQCAIILRRPTISKPSQDIWKSKVGQICGKSYTLGNLSGYTTVYNPQITFNGNKNADGVTMKPLQSEIEEIYQALEKGVIL